MTQLKTLGIDATNLSSGGGLNHLVEFLSAANPTKKQGFDRIVIWGPKTTLSQLENKKWLIKISLPAHNQGLVSRTIWQRFHLSKAAFDANCQILFVPVEVMQANSDQ